MKKLDNNEFINRIKKMYGSKYDYSKVNYINNKTKIIITCPKHGLIEVIPSNILSGQGCCKECGKLNITSNTYDFIKKANEIHNNKYDYSLVNYKNSYTKVKIICLTHGVFEQKPNSHICNKRGCQKCYGNQRKTTEQFIIEAKNKHNDKYDYSLVNYKNSYTKVKIICSTHGVFEQRPNNHLNGEGCFLCIWGKYEFIKKAKKIHGDKYDYSLAEYKRCDERIKIICPIHGTFEQQPKNHINSSNGCPHCNESKGEKVIRNFLIENNINYISQKTFEGCKYKRKLPFDFYLPDYNVCIEYDGEQHFKNISNWGISNPLYIQNVKDEIKNNFCKINNIKLIRIKYDENILEKLIYCL